ncbi:MAG: hypothetical protein M3Y33_05075 [Actinomycetota bacterium]|nr:hypothetical protein [Actinomycetota bacterium]
MLIDFIHVVQHLRKTAGSFFYPHDPAARDWAREQAAKILDGKAGDVAAGIRRRATRFGYAGKEREGADTCATYLDNKAGYLDYPAFLAAGRPIASGLIEGACRWQVKTGWKSPAPGGDSKTPKPPSSCAPSPGTATSTTTSPATSSRKSAETTTTSTSNPRPDHSPPSHPPRPAPLRPKPLTLNSAAPLTAYLDECGRNGGKPLTGPDLERFLPWNASPENLRTWAQPPPGG